MGQAAGSGPSPHPWQAEPATHAQEAGDQLEYEENREDADDSPDDYSNGCDDEIYDLAAKPELWQQERHQQSQERDYSEDDDDPDQDLLEPSQTKAHGTYSLFIAGYIAPPLEWQGSVCVGAGVETDA